jgi:hypothetical protein
MGINEDRNSQESIKPWWEGLKIIEKALRRGYRHGHHVCYHAAAKIGGDHVETAHQSGV